MANIQSQRVPLIALSITIITAFLSENHLPYVHTYVVYRYAAAIVVIYAFFRFITFSDKRRATQLDEVGLLRPLHDGAFFICTHSHLRHIGVALGWLSPHVSIEIGLLSWASILIGHYAPKQTTGLPNRLIHLLPQITPYNKHFFCNGLIVSGCIGILGTFTATLQIVWLLLPLTITLWLTSRKNVHNAQ
ncbi:MAG: hypothetical protein ACO36I_06435 [Candidatus Latescibacterota bacterium]|jgi:hypothetical protein